MISLSFANVKEMDYKTTRKKICQMLTKLYAENSFLLDSGLLYETDVAASTPKHSTAMDKHTVRMLNNNFSFFIPFSFSFSL